MAGGAGGGCSAELSVWLEGEAATKATALIKDLDLATLIGESTSALLAAPPADGDVVGALAAALRARRPRRPASAARGDLGEAAEATLWRHRVAERFETAASAVIATASFRFGMLSLRVCDSK